MSSRNGEPKKKASVSSAVVKGTLQQQATVVPTWFLVELGTLQIICHGERREERKRDERCASQGYGQGTP